MIHINQHSSTASDPALLEEGLYGATFYMGKEPLYVRMERVTAENSEHWKMYRDYCYTITNGARGLLTVLTRYAGIDLKLTQYTEQVGEITGFTDVEYMNFLEKLKTLREKTNGKILGQLGGIPAGLGAFCLSPNSEDYVVYVTKNSAFSIKKVCALETPLNYKKFSEVYSDILITVGSYLVPNENRLHNRGIARNPYWVLEEKYAGLSMLLHGFSCMVAESFFPHRDTFRVNPTGSMQAILTKQLQKGDGYADNNIDITELSLLPDDSQLYNNTIKVSALTRIYRETVAQLAKS